MGWILVERGKLDEAEALYRQCLELNPDDSHAKAELDYIAQQRAKRPRVG
jgi:tetratricopeptide (TPR) repeat protein